MDGVVAAGGGGQPVDGCFAPAHNLTTAPWTTLRVALSHLDGPCGPDHTAHSAYDDQKQRIQRWMRRGNRGRSD